MRRPSDTAPKPLGWSELDALVSRRAIQAERATDAEVDRIVALPDPMDRMAAHAALVRLLGEDGTALSPAASDRILRTLHRDAEARERDERRARWLAERRRLALLHALRPIAAAGCAVAAVLPFVAGAWRWGWGLGYALALFLTSGAGLAGMVLAVVGSGDLARQAGRASSLEGLAWPLLGALAAGTAGLAVAVAGV